MILNSLVETKSTVSQRAAFAVLLARALHRLAGWKDQPTILSSQLMIDDPAGIGDSRRTGDVVVLSGSRMAGNLLSSNASAIDTSPAGNSWPELWKICLLLTGVLFLTNIILHTRGRIS